MKKFEYIMASVSGALGKAGRPEDMEHGNWTQNQVSFHQGEI